VNISFPNLEPVERSREYNQYSKEQREEIVYLSLFHSYTNRRLDEKVLFLEPPSSKGYQAMGILHHLGLNAKHKGLFKEYTIPQALELISRNKEYNQIGEMLKSFYELHIQLFEGSGYKLSKQVGQSQFQDGLRVNNDFFNIFNNETSIEYVKRGKSRNIYIFFNGNIFPANYRHENQSDKTIHLERIGFEKSLINEFEKVFPDKQGVFEVEMGKDGKHFTIKKDIDMSPEDLEITCKKIVSKSLPQDKKQREAALLEKIDKENKNSKEVQSVEVKTKSYRSNPILKEQLKILYEYKCQICGTQIKKIGWKSTIPPVKQYNYLMADIHHIIPLHQGGKDSSENMICVCPNCHKRLHTGEYRLDNKSEEINYINSISNEYNKICTKHKIKIN
jgi:predicted HNH restriction endonuclease